MPKASDNIKIYRNPNGPVVSTVNRRVLEQDGLTFKDIDGPERCPPSTTGATARPSAQRLTLKR